MIASEGRHKKFVSAIEQVCYNAEFAEREGRTAIFVTERAVFRAVDGTLELCEVAPGISIDDDILAHMAFRPRLAPTIEQMDVRLFRAEPMGLLSDLKDRRPPRSEQVPLHAG
jgi:propionate CoA-transferase